MPSILNEAIKPSLLDIESERAKAQRLAEYYTAILRNEEENTTPKLRGTYREAKVTANKVTYRRGWLKHRKYVRL